MNPVTDTITFITEQPGMALGFTVVSVVVWWIIMVLWQNDQGVKFHEELLADGECPDHSIWHFTWPKVDDEWTGVVNIVCDRCNHTERVPPQWSLTQYVWT